MNRKFNRIKSFEESFFKSSEDNPQRIFRNINKDQWIADVSWPFDAYKILSELPLGNVLPGHVKLWINNLRILLGNKKLNKRGYKNLAGYLLLFPFAKKKKLNIHAEAFFFKRNSKYVVLFYPRTKSIFKLNLRPHRKEYFLNFIKEEVKSQQLANQIIHSKISVPAIKSYNLNGDFLYLEQEFISGSKSIKYLSDKKISSIYEDIFDFLFHFYKHNTFTQKIIEKPVLNSKKIEYVFNLLEKDKELFNRFNKIISLKKHLIYGRIHNDLSTENILYTKEKIFLIDWGESKDDYWVKEIIKSYKFLNEAFLEKYFSQLIVFFNFNKDTMYSYKDQLFLIISMRIFEKIEKQEKIENRLFLNEINNLFNLLEKFCQN